VLQFIVALLTLSLALSSLGAEETYHLASSGSTGSLGSGSDYRQREVPLFPAALWTEDLRARQIRDAGRPYWVPTQEEQQALSAAAQVSLLLNNDILLYYGHPLSQNMGVLGRFPKDELQRRLGSLAAEYQAVGGRNVLTGFHLIYGTVWPGGDIGVIRQSVLEEWIQWTQDNGMLLVLDHQIGRFDPIAQLRSLLPYLHYPHVHLALDPEWRTPRPMQEIGHLTAAEINQMQAIMEDYMIEHNISGERLLIIHQFNQVMIRSRQDIRTDFSRVRLVHNIAGIGPPRLKRDTYAFGAQAANMPVKGFKLWYDFGISGHTDSPLMSPREVMELNPRPYVIMYQ